MNFVFPSPVTMDKITRKEMLNFRVTSNDRDMVKCCRNVNFDKMETERSTGTNDGF